MNNKGQNRYIYTRLNKKDEALEKYLSVELFLRKASFRDGP